MTGMTQAERTDDMLRRYGEVVKRTDAARILGCGAKKIAAMLEDGRLLWACGGTMVDVRSIAVYICAPRRADSEARIEKMMAVRNCRYHV